MPKKFRKNIHHIFSKITPGKKKQVPSVADPGCLSRIPDPNCLHPGSPIRIKEFNYFKTKKMVSKL